MFAPLVLRLLTYDVRLDGVCAAYADAVEAHPAVRGRRERAAQGNVIIPACDHAVG